MDHKDRVRAAVESSARKQLSLGKVPRKNKKPEKQTEKDVKAWLRRQGFDFNVIESKAVYSQAAGRYMNGQTDPGVSDIIGNDKEGHAMFIELKAKGKRYNVSPVQYMFLMKKIKMNCFAVCVDSDVSLNEQYAAWVVRKQQRDINGARQYLESMLPRPRKMDQYDESTPLFECED